MTTRATAQPVNLAEKLEVFFSLFRPTIELAENLVAERSNAQEVILLICARLDALATSIASEDQSNRNAFVHLLVNYSGHRDLMESVSAGNLYYELGYHRWLAEGLIPKPGRLHRFSRLNDPILYLLDRGGMPLTVEAAQRLLTCAMRGIARTFRCRLGQPLKKPMVGKPKEVMAALSTELRRSRGSDLKANLEDAFRPILESKTVANILYESFRNSAVHDIKVEVDEDLFFSGTAPYWQPLHSEYYPPFLFIKFPALFLIGLLRNCLQTSHRKMLATGKLPPDVHYHVFGTGINNLQFLEDKLLPNASYLRFQHK